MRKYEKVTYPGFTKGYLHVSPDRVLAMPLGTKVIVHLRKADRPYVVVRWGKHRLKRLKWQQHLDPLPSCPELYLPIRPNRLVKYKVEAGK